MRQQAQTCEKSKWVNERQNCALSDKVEKRYINAVHVPFYFGFPLAFLPYTYSVSLFPLAAMIGLLYPCIDSRLGEPHKFKREWSSVMRCVAVFVGINHASAVSLKLWGFIDLLLFFPVLVCRWEKQPVCLRFWSQPLTNWSLTLPLSESGLCQQHPAISDSGGALHRSVVDIRPLPQWLWSGSQYRPVSNAGHPTPGLQWSLSVSSLTSSVHVDMAW